MIDIMVSIADCTVEITTDEKLSFDAIETLMARATKSAIDAYAQYVVVDELEESILDDDE